MKTVTAENSDSVEKLAADEAKVLLFTTKTCPNCKLAKRSLDDAGVAYTVVDAEEQLDLVSEFGVSQAPTLVVVNGAEAQKYVNASNINRYAASQKK